MRDIRPTDDLLPFKKKKKKKKKGLLGSTVSDRGPLDLLLALVRFKEARGPGPHHEGEPEVRRERRRRRECRGKGRHRGAKVILRLPAIERYIFSFFFFAKNWYKTRRPLLLVKRSLSLSLFLSRESPFLSFLFLVHFFFQREMRLSLVFCSR